MQNKILTEGGGMFKKVTYSPETFVAFFESNLNYSET
jgi:hypothetical protein